MNIEQMLRARLDAALVSSSEIIGKTVETVIEESTKLYIKFTDGTFLDIQASQCYDDVVLDTEGSTYPIWNHVDLGIITKEEMEQMYKDEEYDSEMLLKNERKRQYEILKKEFENG